jgi:hypothetical protein
VFALAALAAAYSLWQDRGIGLGVEEAFKIHPVVLFVPCPVPAPLPEVLPNS